MEKIRILVVDDETDFLEITRMNLQGTGKYDVLTLSRANDIVDHIHHFKPQIILLDILMPGIGGIEACEMLNTDAMGKGIPIIILSALDKESDKLKAYKVGVVDYLIKPIEKNELINKIEKALRYK